MADYEGRWRCDYCRAENLGRDRSCLACGTSIGENVAFYLPAGAAPLEDGDLVEEARSGKAWHCDHCETMNLNKVKGALVTSCRTCGNARDSSDRNRAVNEVDVGSDRSSAPIMEEHQDPGADASGWSGASAGSGYAADFDGSELSGPDRARSRSSSRPSDVHPSVRRASDRRSEAAARVISARSLSGRMRAMILGGLVAVLLLLSLFVPVSTRDAQILHAHWERAMSIEELQTFQRSGFDPPGDARIHDRDWRFRKNVDVPVGTRQVEAGMRDVATGSRQVECGFTDNGNGYFSTKYCSKTIYTPQMSYRTETIYRTDRVYDWHYRYEIDRWTEILREETNGTDSEPVWPDVEPIGDKQRLARPSDTYRLEIDVGGDGSQMITLDEAGWRATGAGRGIPVRVNIWGRALYVADS